MLPPHASQLGCRHATLLAAEAMADDYDYYIS
jgi:hypothetical protein